MSILDEREKYADKEEIIAYLKSRIQMLEEELRILKTLLAKLEPGAVEEEFDPTEKIEEIRVSRRTIAKVGIGGDYVRVVFKFPAVLPDELRSYLESTIKEIVERQAVSGVPPEERARLEVRRGPEKQLRELRIRNITTPLERVKAKAALKYVAELMYKLQKKQSSREKEQAE